MNDRTIRIEISQRGFAGFLALLTLVLSAGDTAPESLTLSTTYPAPSGIYAQLITTGKAGGNVKDTILSRDAGNVGIGTASPSEKLDVAGKIHATDDVCTDAGGGACLSSAGGGSSRSCQVVVQSGTGGGLGSPGVSVIASCPGKKTVRGGAGLSSAGLVSSCPASGGGCVGNQGPPLTANQWFVICPGTIEGQVTYCSAWAICCD